jgi:hypothetical protein
MELPVFPVCDEVARKALKLMANLGRHRRITVRMEAVMHLDDYTPWVAEHAVILARGEGGEYELSAWLASTRYGPHAGPDATRVGLSQVSARCAQHLVSAVGHEVLCLAESLASAREACVSQERVSDFAVFMGADVPFVPDEVLLEASLHDGGLWEPMSIGIDLGHETPGDTRWVLLRALGNVAQYLDGHKDNVPGLNKTT